MDTSLQSIHLRGGAAASVTVADRSGNKSELAVSHVISSIPMGRLVESLDPPPPPDVLKAAGALHYRDYLTVALVVPKSAGFPDNWIYIHATDVQVGRIQNFGSWSPDMVKQGRTCLGLEYFVFEGDELWNSSDEDLVAKATRELASLGLVGSEDVEVGYVVRVPKAYPYYDFEYRSNVEIIRSHLADVAPNVHLVGRNGMHKYNNQDHSMYTAMLTVENILFGAGHDIWSVNVEEEYLEQIAGPPSTGDASVADASGETSASGETRPMGRHGGTGRGAPVLPGRTEVADLAARNAPTAER